MAIYNQLRRRDIVIMCYDLLKSGFLVMRDVDGKLDFGPAATAWDVPWHFVIQKGTLNCLLWNRVMFNVIFKKAPASLLQGHVWVPSGCQACYKVVARPKTLKQLFATVELQKRLGWHAKCGIEHRAHVFGLYGAYWYFRGLEQGLSGYQMVRKAIDEDPLLGSEVNVILKRGCTEMEMEAGPSDKYEVYPEQMIIENLVYDYFNIDLLNRRQPEHAVDYVHARWIEYAYQWGDETVFEYLDPEMPIYKPLVTYQHLLEQNDNDLKE